MEYRRDFQLSHPGIVELISEVQDSTRPRWRGFLMEHLPLGSISNCTGLACLVPIAFSL